MVDISIINKFKKPFLYAAILLPIMVFAYYVYKYATNMPREDDYDAILGFLTAYKHADTGTQLELLFKQHNEHRIMPSRVVYVIYYKLFGQMNFRHITMLNGVVLTLLFLNIAYFIKKAIPKYWLQCVLVTSLCIYDLSGFENMNFSMAGMQNFGVILAFTGSILFYSLKKRWALIPAVLLQVICAFSSGNGNLGSAIIVLYAIFSKDRVKMMTAVGTFLLSAPLYYVHYTKPSNDFSTLDPLKFIPFFLHAAGAHFSLTYGIAAGGMLVAVLFGVRPIGKRLSIEPEVLPLVCLGLFALGSLGVMSIFRGAMPLWCSTASRYHIYSHILTALAFIFLMIAMQHERITQGLATVLIAILFLFYYWNEKDGSYGMKAFRVELKTMPYHYPDSARARQIAEEACKENIYCIEKHRSDSLPKPFKSTPDDY